MDNTVPFTYMAVEKRDLSTPTMSPICVDDNENLARSLFGPAVANVCVCRIVNLRFN